MEYIIKNNLLNLIIMLLVLICYTIFPKYIKYSIKLFSNIHNIKRGRKVYLKKLSRILQFLLILILPSIIWVFSFHDMVVIKQCCIQSNNFFLCPFKTDDRIEIFDGDNNVEGRFQT